MLRRMTLQLLSVLAFLPLVISTAMAQETHNIWLPIISTQPGTVTTALCRFGVNHHTTSLSLYDLASLRTGFYIDYLAVPPSAISNNMEHFQMIRLRQTGADSYAMAPDVGTVSALAAASPGAVWLIGNEPDRRVYQDDMEPLPYAIAYHDIYTQLKEVDPSARIFAGNIVQATELRLKYLDKVLAAYAQRYGAAMPVDGWSMHAFILNEKSGEWGAGIPPGLSETEGQVINLEQTADINLFKQQITAFRQWMLANGYRDRPLYVTEYGVLMPSEYGFPPSVVNAYMTDTFNFMLSERDAAAGYPWDDNRLVQRFSWYSIADKIHWDAAAEEWRGFNGYLFDPDLGNARSAMGDNFAQYTEGVTDATDFLVGDIFAEALPSDGGQTLRISARIHNAGNTSSRQPFVVQFYLGDPAAGGQLLPQSETSGSLSGCADIFTAEYTWTNAPIGLHRIFVLVAPGTGTSDVNLQQNSGSISIDIIE